MHSAESEKPVKMHDMIHDMASWLTTKNEENKKKVVIKERARMVVSRDFVEWKEAQMISLWDIDRVSLFDRSIAGPKVPYFPMLETLFLRRSSMEEIPTGFLEKFLWFKFLTCHIIIAWECFGRFIS